MRNRLIGLALVAPLLLAGPFLAAPMVSAQEATVTDLGLLGGNYSEAYGINNLGQAVGISTTASGDYHAFLWTGADGMTDPGQR